MTEVPVETPPSGNPARQVEFADAVKLFFTNYIAFEGRSSRGAYWWAVLFVVVGQIVLDLIIPFLGTLFSLATLIPGIGLGVRRLHDIGRSGWWTLIAFTVIGLIPLIYWACQPGERSENRFGPDVEQGR